MTARDGRVSKPAAPDRRRRGGGAQESGVSHQRRREIYGLSFTKRIRFFSFGRSLPPPPPPLWRAQCAHTRQPLSFFPSFSPHTAKLLERKRIVEPVPTVRSLPGSTYERFIRQRNARLILTSFNSIIPSLLAANDEFTVTVLPASSRPGNLLRGVHLNDLSTCVTRRRRFLPICLINFLVLSIIRAAAVVTEDC